jgi:acyl-CoA thioester hydrolase
MTRITVTPPLEPEAYAFTWRIRVRFAETDAMGVVHHAAYLPYLEETRVAYLRSLGHPYTALREEGLEFPVVQVAVSYRRPLRFDDLVEVHLLLAATSGATFQIAYLLTREEEEVAHAVSLHAALSTSGRVARVPPWLQDSAVKNRP